MRTSWDLTKLYKSPNDPNIQKDIDNCVEKNKLFVEKWKQNSRYLEDPKTLQQALKEYEELEEIYGLCNKPIYYYILLNSLDQTDTEVKAKLNKISDISVKLSNDIQFFFLNISKIPKEKQKEFLDSPLLINYKHLLEREFLQAKYLLSEKEENVFTLVGKTSHSNWVDMLSEILDKQQLEVKEEDGHLVEITYNSISKYLNSKNKKVRDYAAKKFNDINKRYSEIAEFELNSILEFKKIEDEYRGIDKPEFARHISDDMDSEVVNTLVKIVTKNFALTQKYYKYRAKQLGVKQIAYYERNVPLGEVQKELNFEDSIQLVEDTFDDLDRDFGNIVREYKKDGTFDVYPKKGKSGGGFCITMSKSLPTYILLNYLNRVDDVLTIAHECGHGIHAEMSKIQSPLNSGHPTSLAETASTFFEDFVLERMLKDADSDTKFYILNQKIHDDTSSIFRQVALYNFEKELHSEFRKKGYLNKDEISKMFCKHMTAYLGDSVKQDDSMKYGWVYWSHIRDFFYVYTYANGLLISKGLQSMVKENSENIEYVKRFLSSGSTKSPREIFNEMGIDISKKDIWEKGISEVKCMIDNLI